MEMLEQIMHIVNKYEALLLYMQHEYNILGVSYLIVGGWGMVNVFFNMLFEEFDGLIMDGWGSIKVALNNTVRADLTIDVGLW